MGEFLIFQSFQLTSGIVEFKCQPVRVKIFQCGVFCRGESFSVESASDQIFYTHINSSLLISSNISCFLFAPRGSTESSSSAAA